MVGRKCDFKTYTDTEVSSLLIERNTEIYLYPMFLLSKHIGNIPFYSGIDSS